MDNYFGSSVLMTSRLTSEGILQSKLPNKSTLKMQEKRYRCKICGIDLIPRDKKQVMRDGTNSSSESYLKERRISLHHIDYQKNIAIRVCPSCHVKLHNSMKNHKYGINNVIRKDGTKKGHISPGRYPKKIID